MEEVLKIIKLRGKTSIDYLKEKFNVKTTQELKELIRELDRLESMGKIVRENDYFDLPERLGYIIGNITRKSVYDSYIKDQLQKQVYIPVEHLNTAIDNDLVMVKVESNRYGPFGRVVKVLERSNQYLTGILTKNRNKLMLIPSNETVTARVFVKNGNVVPGNAINKIVQTEIKEYFSNNTIEVDYLKTLGDKDDERVIILEKINSKLGVDFPEEVEKEVETVDEEIRKEDFFKRVDLRNELIITIDGDDSKDLDDAVSLKFENGLYRLGVHIADVSHYVKEKASIDEEAYKRGTSVYFPGYVVPMLPKELSNGICSLNPGVDRLTISCEMLIDKTGKVVEYNLYPSVINSKFRMTYTNVNRLLADEEMDEYKSIKDLVFKMRDLRDILSNDRTKRGAINFEENEVKIDLDEEGYIVGIHKVVRGESETIIEEFMIKANETVATHFMKNKLPFIYRIHEEPSGEKIARIRDIFGEFVGMEVTHEAIQEALEKYKDLELGELFNRLLLQAMAKAKYDYRNLKHFGLASSAYTHFTSPIRRYPDLTVHRLIKDFVVNKSFNKKTFDKWNDSLGAIANNTSNSERKAIDIERHVEDIYKALYIYKQPKRVFKGVITNVLGFGFFVEIMDSIEGLVHVTNLGDDYYAYDEHDFTLTGENNKVQYKIGYSITVKVVNIDVYNGKIDLVPYGGKK